MYIIWSNFQKSGRYSVTHKETLGHSQAFDPRVTWAESVSSRGNDLWAVMELGKHNGGQNQRRASVYFQGLLECLGGCTASGVPPSRDYSLQPALPTLARPPEGLPRAPNLFHPPEWLGYYQPIWGPELNLTQTLLRLCPLPEDSYGVLLGGSISLSTGLRVFGVRAMTEWQASPRGELKTRLT